MTDEKDKISVQVKYGNFEKSLSGSLEEVWLGVNKVFNEFLPTFNIAKKLLLSVDLQQLVEDCKGIVAFSSEGANVLVPRDRLTDNETLMLWLLAGHVGFRLGLLKTDVLSKDELQARLGKSAKIVSTRSGELVKDGLVSKVDEGYRVTTLCVFQMQKDALPRIRSKLQC